jgi:hypothetical protein
LDEYQEPLSVEQFEQQQETFEEGKYNMSILSLLNTISYCILILYGYKDILNTAVAGPKPAMRKCGGLC